MYTYTVLTLLVGLFTAFTDCGCDNDPPTPPVVTVTSAGVDGSADTDLDCAIGSVVAEYLGDRP
jgi:hypothetical protein